MIVTKQAHSDGDERKKWRDGWRERKIMIEGRREGGWKIKTVWKVIVRLVTILSKDKWEQTLFKGKDLILKQHTAFFPLCQSLGFHQTLNVLSYLFSWKLKNIMFIFYLFTCLLFICFLKPYFSFCTFDTFLLPRDLFRKGWTECYIHREEIHLRKGKAKE